VAEVPLSAAEQARYSRHLLLEQISNAGQERLRAARVLVVGAGGLGSPAAMYLAAAGIGTLGLLDFDRVELSNLHRQLLFDSSQVGQSKAVAGRARLLALNPLIQVTCHAVELTAANARALIEPYDLVVDGSDRLSTRYLVNDSCVIFGKMLVSAAIHRFEGQAMSFLPGKSPCYRCLFPDTPEHLVPNCAEAGVLGVLPGVLGTIQATEAIKLLLGIGEPLLGRLLTFDALEMRYREFGFARRTDCAVCGERPSITRPGQDTESAAVQTATQLTARQLHELLQRSAASGGREPLLIDVREPREFAVGHLDNSRNIPLGELPQRFGELAADRSLVFICRSGRRSAAAGTMALRAGFDHAANLEGGLLAWAETIDPQLTVAPA
jgi:sulfur-carrier protein adenylyltransferase/sulfurtransferase